jgi:hypothetical protein
MLYIKDIRELPGKRVTSILKYYIFCNTSRILPSQSGRTLTALTGAKPALNRASTGRDRVLPEYGLVSLAVPNSSREL